ncbi:THAP domain-containing protein 2-like [Cylas formicarius]|uniref:THAP domain-containing protein 2-like n=1 Tax=Cylas formicarius TaxID=197179 RepID=UPI002958A2F3|nr:THAP domain-containing protein 2-like [Cylas formicarius]XP_060522363.1 THAP domain-containing protein 2-like [Cylas formicarius]XP_060522364.1 THAP domain-containing protein 2-like [Cylas formicarius]
MSGTTCAVYNCNNSYKKRLPGITFHRFPKSIVMRKKWVHLCSRNANSNIANGIICSEHFLPEDFKRDLRNELLGLPLKKRLKEHAVPSQKLFEIESKKSRFAVKQVDSVLNKKKASIVSNFLIEKIVIVDIQGKTEETIVEVNQGTENLLENKSPNSFNKFDASSVTSRYNKELLGKQKT